jgi:hypothetical protein
MNHQLHIQVNANGSADVFSVFVYPYIWIHNAYKATNATITLSPE